MTATAKPNVSLWSQGYKGTLLGASAQLTRGTLYFPVRAVHETLTFASDLRLPRSFTLEQRAERIKEVSEAMGVAHVHNVVIGNAMIKACPPAQPVAVLV